MDFILSRKLLYGYIILLPCICLLWINISWASEPLIGPDGDASIKYSAGCIERGDCELNDFVRILIRATEIIFGIVGSLALLMIVYGGLLIILAGETTITGTEKSSKVNKGKDAIKNAIIGLVIVFIAYVVIGFIFKATGADPTGTAWSKTDWFSSKTSGN